MLKLSPLEHVFVFYGTRVPNHPRKWWLHSQLRRWVGVRPNREFDVVRDGLRWRLNPADFADEALFWLGTKDTWDVDHLKRLAKAGDVILDVGANFGYYGLTLARALQGECTVHALEPDPVNFERLRRHVECNQLDSVVQTHALGVSDREGQTRLSRHPKNSGHSAVAADGEVGGVQLTTLDCFCDAAGLERLDIMVLDVEGLEERALAGAVRSIARFRPLIFVELFPPVMSRQGSSPEAATQVLTEQGYQLFAAQRSRLEPLKQLPAGDHRRNVFAFHRERTPESVHAGTL
jgi:FkbM family methyltransferase